MLTSILYVQSLVELSNSLKDSCCSITCTGASIAGFRACVYIYILHTCTYIYT